MRKCSTFPPQRRPRGKGKWETWLLGRAARKLAEKLG